MTVLNHKLIDEVVTNYPVKFETGLHVPQTKLSTPNLFGRVDEWLRRLSTLGYYGYMLDSLGAYAQCSRLGVTRSF